MVNLPPIDIAPPHPGFEQAWVVHRNAALIVDQVHERLGDKPCIVWLRQRDEYPMTRFTIGLGRLGLPEFVVTGNTDGDAIESVFEKAVESCLEYPIERREITSTEEFVVNLNAQLAASNQTDFRFVAVDTEQFMYGPGLTAKRFYGRGFRQIKVIQLLYAFHSRFPHEEGYPFLVHPQPLLPTVRFGEKPKGGPNDVIQKWRRGLAVQPRHMH